MSPLGFGWWGLFDLQDFSTMRHSTHELNDVYRKGNEFLTVNITTANADRALYQPKRCTLFIRFFFNRKSP